MPSGQHTAIGERVYVAASGVVVPRVFFGLPAPVVVRGD